MYNNKSNLYKRIKKNGKTNENENELREHLTSHKFENYEYKEGDEKKVVSHIYKNTRLGRPRAFRGGSYHNLKTISNKTRTKSKKPKTRKLQKR